MDPYTEVGLLVKPILPSGFGAEVEGVDWTVSPLPDNIISTLVSLQDKYGVIIFRQTGLDNERQVRFAGQLGKLEENPAWGGTQRVGTPFLFDVSNVEADGSIVKEGTRRWAHSLGNALWHTDSSFNQHRSKYSMLLAHAVPPAGQGNTGFADTRQAWKDLSEERKATLRHLIVKHDLWHSRRLASPDIYAVITDEERQRKPPAYHNLVQQTETGEETFFLAAHAASLFTRDCQPVEDSQEVIWKLIDHCTQPKYTFFAEWLNKGDMMWWDNRQSMHRASPYNKDMGVRDVRRATVYDDGKNAFGVATSLLHQIQDTTPSKSTTCEQDTLPLGQAPPLSVTA